MYAFGLEVGMSINSDWRTAGYNRIGANINADQNRINRAWNIPFHFEDEKQFPAFYCWEFFLKSNKDGIAINIGLIEDGTFSTIPGKAPELPRLIGYRNAPVMRREEFEPITLDRSYWANRKDVRPGTSDMIDLDSLTAMNAAGAHPPNFVATVHVVIDKNQ